MEISSGQAVANGIEADADSGQNRAQTRSAAAHAAFEGYEPFRVPATPRSVLIQIIEGEIIPRLFLAHRDQVQRPVVQRECGDLSNCAFLCGLFLNGDSADIVRRLEREMDRGTRREDIYLEFLACVPRTLSLSWEEGHCTFDEMARGLNCLDEVLQEMRQRERDADGPN